MPVLMLEGVRGGQRNLKEFAHSASGMIRLLKRDGFSTAANENGALTVWKMSNGYFRGERHFHYSVRDEITTKKFKEISDFVKKQYPFIL